MSIIDQALKKTQQALDESTQLKKNPAQKKTRNKTHRYIFYITSVFLCIPILYIATSKLAPKYAHFYGQLLPATIKKPLATAASPAATPSPPPSVVALSNAASLPTLDGTLLMGNSSLALIDHHMLHVGEEFEGYRIKQIHFNDVEIENLKTHDVVTLQQKLNA